MTWNIDAHNGGREQLDALAAPRREPAQPSATNALPLKLRSGRKQPAFAQAGCDILTSYAELNEEERDAFRWLEQSEHLAPDNGEPHTYIYAPRAPAQSPGTMLMLASQGPPYPAVNAKAALTNGATVVMSTTIVDKYKNAANTNVLGTKLRGKTFRLVRFTTDHPTHPYQHGRDFEYLHDFQLVHVGLHVDGDDQAGSSMLSAAALALPVPHDGAADAIVPPLQLTEHDNQHVAGIEEDFDYAMVEDLMRPQDETIDSRTTELEAAVYDDHEPRLQSIEALMANAQLANPAGQPGSSSSADAHSLPISTIKAHLMVLLQGSDRPKDKLELRRELLAQSQAQAPELLVKDVNRALYELEREGRVAKDVSGSSAKPLWRLSGGA